MFYKTLCSDYSLSLEKTILIMVIAKGLDEILTGLSENVHVLIRSTALEEKIQIDWSQHRVEWRN